MDQGKGLIVDTETTGLDSTRDEVIELGLVLFSYDKESCYLTGIVETYSGLREPSIPISSRAAKIHGLKKSNLYGKSFDENTIRRLFESADFFIAHNASFDRRFLSRIYPEIRERNWYCSMNDISWKGYGHQSKSLQKLIADFQIRTENAHRGLNDAMAVYALLSQINELTQKTFFDELLNGFSEPTYTKREKLPKVEIKAVIPPAKPKKSFFEFLFRKRS